MGKDQNTFLKRKREMDKKRKAEEKLERRRRKKEETHDTGEAASADPSAADE